MKNFKDVSIPGLTLKGGGLSMRQRMVIFLIIGMLSSVLCPVCNAQERGYFSQMGQTFTRGIKNVVSFPWEIPATIKEHDAQNNGTPRFVRDTAGFFDGTLRALTRFGCGAWDMVWCVVPGNQEGLPLKPESFF